MQWHVKTFQELTKSELYELLRLRTQVFVVEQKCAYQELDSKDQKALHLLGFKADKLVAYARCFTDLEMSESSFGRVLVTPEERGKGLAHQLVEKCIQTILAENKSVKKIIISAQEHLQDFYAQHGFSAEGNPYLEDDIPHIRMVWKK